MKKVFTAILGLLMLYLPAANGQTGPEELKLSLAEAQNWAIENNLSIVSARYDTEASRLALWEAISAGLPQVNGSASLNDNLKLMTTLLPGEFFGQPGVKIPVQFGSKYNSSFGAQASMLLFNGPYLVGIQTAQLAGRLTSLSLGKTEQDTRESVAMSYYLILIAEESMKILDGNIEALNETLRSTRSMLSAGMAEATDVDQMVSNVSMMSNTRSSMERTLELNYNMLRFQLGVSAETKLTLTESLETIVASTDVASVLATEFNVSDNINYKLLEGQEQMSELTLKMQKASTLPTLSTFYSYSKSGMGDKLNDLQWFPNSMLGFQLSVPIFASGDRYTKIKKAQVNLEKARTGKEMLSEQLLLQERQLRYNLVNAREQFNLQKSNIEVSKRIYASVENKYRQGMASSLEVTQANSNYLQAENNYISALMTLLQSKLALDKLLGNF
ncbi:MAG: TolC family protein [Bacteroidales bacterium]|nr:TolC family protein [Bacteroidales bacterium]